MTVADEPYFVVNRNQGIDTLHDQHSREECNLDDAEDLRKVDSMTAEALLVGGHAVACKHCGPRPEG